jgi:hypothetical protein
MNLESVCLEPGTYIKGLGFLRDSNVLIKSLEKL